MEELESESGDEYDVMGGDRRVFSDPLKFTGIDMAPRERRAYAYDDEDDDTSEDSDSDESGMSATQLALRDKEEALVQSALARIKRARERGKVEVKLKPDELAALESRRKRLQAAEAAKAKKAAEKAKKKKSSPPMVSVPLTQPDIQYVTSRPSSRRTNKSMVPNDSMQGGPGILVESADGRVMYQPVIQGSPGRPRSSSSMSQKGRHQPLQQYYSMNSRHASEGTRPPSSASQSSRPLPHEEGWIDSRRSSLSSQSQYGLDPYEYQIRNGNRTPPQPGYGVQYSNIPRAVPTQFMHSNSDPTLGSARTREFTANDLADSSDEHSDPTHGGVKVSHSHPGNSGQVAAVVEVLEKEKKVDRKPVPKRKGSGGSGKSVKGKSRKFAGW